MEYNVYIHIIIYIYTGEHRNTKYSDGLQLLIQTPVPQKTLERPEMLATLFFSETRFLALKGMTRLPKSSHALHNVKGTEYQ